MDLNPDVFDTHEIRQMTGRVLTVEALQTAAESFDCNCDQGVVDIMIRTDVTRELTKFRTESGISLEPAGAAAKLRDALEVRHDVFTTRQAAQWDKDLTATVQDLESRIAWAMEPPVEKNPDRADMRKLVLYREWERRTLSDVVRAYEATADHKDPTFVALVESSLDDIESRLRLRADDGDPQAIMRLSTLVSERREKRVDPAAREALAALQGMRTLPRESAINHARRGKLEVARNRRPGQRAS